MSCEICGERCQGNRCAGCEKSARAEARSPGEETSQQTATPVTCTVCGADYTHTDDQQQCPDCGSRRRRYAGEVLA
jgi:DNA-directed RNA polymerase subunit RPC12/RpoP